MGLQFNKNILPKEYVQVEYLESTGTQYIDTDIIPNNNMDFSIKTQFSDLNLTGQCIAMEYRFGNYSTTNGFMIKHYNDGTGMQFYSICKIGVGWDESFKKLANINQSTLNDIYISFKNKYAIINNVNYTTSSVINFDLVDLNGSHKLLLFANSEPTQIIVAQKSTKIYSFICKENDKEIRNMIPCFRKSDNKTGMYDLITKQFFTNVNSDEFICGNLVIEQIKETPKEIKINNKPVFNIKIKDEIVWKSLPQEYQEVEYIYTTKANCIDTLIYPTAETKVYVKFKLIQQSNSWKTIIGCRKGTKNRFAARFFNNADSIDAFFQLSYGAGLTYAQIGGLSQTDALNKITEINFGNGEAYINGNLVGTSKITNTEPFIYSLKLLALNTSETTQQDYGLNIQIYRCIISLKDQTLRNYIPCIRKSDNTVGMYDLVSKTFFASITTNKFIAGPNV